MKELIPALFRVSLALAAILLGRFAHADTEPSAESAIFVVVTSTPRIDSDLDGMPDSYEISAGLNRSFNDAWDDADGDGLTNIEEYNGGTSPLAPDYPQASQAVSALFTFNARIVVVDTDGDGMSDDWESAHGLNPILSDGNQDADGDGLTNSQEYNAGNDPQSNDAPVVSTGVSAPFTANTAIFPFSLTADTDGDGMPDWWEQEYGLNPLVSDAEGDVDGDDVSNFAEYQQGRNPAANESLTEVVSISGAFMVNTSGIRLDSDSDGISDAWEIAHGLDPLRNDVNEDPDGDGRSNLEEYNAGTDPQIDDWRGPSSVGSPLFLADTGGIPGPRTRDSDGDGIPDWWEIQYGLNHTVSDSFIDADGDGASNLVEFNSGSNPIVQDNPSVIDMSGIFLVDTGGRTFDTDADGLPDWWEKLYFDDPRTANPVVDTDGDGIANHDEFLAGSNPLDPSSVFRIAGLQIVTQTNGTQFVIRWVSFEGNSYSIWTAPVAEGPYSLFASGIVASPPFNTSSGTLAGTNGFIRIGVNSRVP